MFFVQVFFCWSETISFVLIWVFFIKKVPFVFVVAKENGDKCVNVYKYMHLDIHNIYIYVCVYKYHIDTYLYTSIDINRHQHTWICLYLYIRPYTVYK